MKQTSVRIDETVLAKLDELAVPLDRTRSWLINEALKQYVEHQQWMADAIQAAVTDADSGVAGVRHADVMARIDAKIEDANSREN